MTRAPAATTEFPPGNSGYHTYEELAAEVARYANAYPGIVRRFSIGTSYQGRQIWAAKISDNVGIDEREPEVLFDGLHHAREHLTAEMTLYTMRLLASNYGKDSRITRIVNTREIFIVFALNPDGGEYDIAGGRYHGWRKNRQPNAGTTAIGTDLNRNYGFRWACCGGSSGNPWNETYRGSAPWSAVETRRLRDFVNSRVVSGRQQIRTAISFHAAGEQILWPYGYTRTDVPSDMRLDDQRAFVAMGRAMARTNGYTPMQSSSLYITDGDAIDWLYGAHRIFAYTFELYPSGGSGIERFYPPDEVIGRETSRNRGAVLYLAEQADCPWRAIGKQARYCAVFADDFELDRGWTVNPAGTDTASSGRWQRGDPQPTTQSGAKQLGTTTSGVNDLVTGRLSGSTAGAYDLDGGQTSVRSRAISLAAGRRYRLTFRYYLAHTAASSSADHLRVRVLGSSGSTVVFREVGDPADDDAAWATANVDLSAFAGQTIRLQVEAADGGAGNLVEAAVDDVRVYPL